MLWCPLCGWTGSKDQLCGWLGDTSGPPSERICCPNCWKAALEREDGTKFSPYEE